jgi:hypothetical protein
VLIDECLTDVVVVTGSMPRPETEISVEFPVPINAPALATSRNVVAVTPPALKEFGPDGITSEENSTSARR